MTVSFSRDELLENLLGLSSEHPLVFLTGPHGSGKTTLLREMGRRRGAPLVQIEPIAATPELLLQAFQELASEVITPANPSLPAYEGLLSAVRSRSTGHLLLLDDLTELRCLSYFPGVTRPFESFVEALLDAGAPTVATSRFSHWLSHQQNPPLTAPGIHVVSIPSLDPTEIRQAGGPDAERIAHVSGGIALHAAVLASHLLEDRNLAEALAQELSVGSRLETECRATLAELVHRARGYGACKAVLQILAREEPLNLTEVSERLERTPGSTRDYLRWLEEVDLIRVADRRYRFVDPIVRTWLRLYAGGRPPSAQSIDEEIDQLLDGLTPPTELLASSDELVEID